MTWIDQENQFIFQTYKRQPLVLERGLGAWVWDTDGNKYLDFFSGLAVNNVGHCHRAVVKAIAAQSRKLIHASNLYYTQPQIQLARTLVERTFPGRVFFSNSGAEANECAIKLSRRWGQKNGGRFQILSFDNSFHGRTMGAITLTGQKKYQKGFDPLLSTVDYAEFNNLDSVKSKITDQTAAIFVEPIQGEGGVQVATMDFLRALRHLCDQHNLLLVFDEVQCGIGRTGRLFAFQHYGVLPDVIAAAKGLGGGLPIGATIASEPIAALLERGDHASTFGGNPVVCAAALAVLETLDDKFLAQVRTKGESLLVDLQSWRNQFPKLVKDVRGQGLMVGIELTIPGESFVNTAREQGLLINCTHETVIRLLPPLSVKKQEIKLAIGILEKIFAEKNKELS